MCKCVAFVQQLNVQLCVSAPVLYLVVVRQVTPTTWGALRCKPRPASVYIKKESLF